MRDFKDIGLTQNIERNIVMQYTGTNTTMQIKNKPILLGPIEFYDLEHVSAEEAFFCIMHYTIINHHRQ